MAALLLAGLTIRSVAAQQGQPAAQEATDPAPAPEPEKSEDPPLPKLEEMQTPTAAQLLHEPPLDWIVLKTSDVIVTQPVYPRPNTQAEMQKKIDAHNAKLKDVPASQVDQWRAEREKLNYMNLTLPGGADQPEYQLHIRFVREIIHHEDLMLRRVNESLDNRDLRGAFELLMRIERTYPKWPGVEEARNRLVFLEAQKRAGAGEVEQAFVSLEDLHRRQPDFPDLSSVLGATADRLIAAAAEADDYRGARHFLQRLLQREPQHEVGRKWQAELLSRANGLLDKSQEATAEKRYDDAVLLADKAARAWPAAPRLPAIHQRAAQRFQRLEAGVARLPGEPTAYPVPTEDDLRHARLTALSLFEVETVDEDAHYRSRFFEEWEPTDLGRRMVFTLRHSMAPWESQRAITASAVFEDLRRRLNPLDSQSYDARLGNHIESLRILSPFEFEIGFAQVPLRVESLLAFPVAGSASAEGPVDAPVATERFREHERSDRNVRARRSVPEPDGLGQYHIAEVVERKYDSYEHAVQGLLRGEVALLPRVARGDVVPLRRDGRFFLQQYALPATHILQFHPDSPVLRHRELRRALAYAIDRQGLLRSRLLPAGSEADSAMERAEQQTWGRLTTAAWPRQHKGYDALVEPHAYDPLLAASLTTAAKKQMGGKVPRLKMICPPDPATREIATELTRQWGVVGLSVELAPDEAPAGGWDILYRTVRMADPQAELWPLLTLQSGTRIEPLAPLPDWLRQEVVRLEQAHDWTTAESLLRELHRHLHADLHLVPLWEVDEFLALRKNVHGLPERPVHCYQNIERWVADSWYPREAP